MYMLLHSTEIQELQLSHQKSQAALNENSMVIEELQDLDEEEQVFRLVGPVLLKQDLVEAKDAVKQRVGFIKEEIAKIEDKLTAKQRELEEIQTKVVAMQQAAAKGK